MPHLIGNNPNIVVTIDKKKNNISLLSRVNEETSEFDFTKNKGRFTLYLSIRLAHK